MTESRTASDAALHDLMVGEGSTETYQSTTAIVWALHDIADSIRDSTPKPLPNLPYHEGGRTLTAEAYDQLVSRAEKAESKLADLYSETNQAASAWHRVSSHPALRTDLLPESDHTYAGSVYDRITQIMEVAEEIDALLQDILSAEGPYGWGDYSDYAHGYHDALNNIQGEIEHHLKSRRTPQSKSESPSNSSVSDFCEHSAGNDRSD